MESSNEEFSHKSVMNVNSYKFSGDKVTEMSVDDHDYDDRDYKPREMSKKVHSKTLKGFCSEDIKKKLADV